MGSGLFVAYEVCLSLALGFASSRNQAIELGVVNYLWPCLTVLLAIVMNGQKALDHRAGQCVSVVWHSLGGEWRWPGIGNHRR